MGSPDAAYKQLMHDYIQSSFRNNKALREKYSDDFIYDLSVEELEQTVKSINPHTPMWNALIAGEVLQEWANNACCDMCNAVSARLPDYFNLFNISPPDKLIFNK